MGADPGNLVTFRVTAADIPLPYAPSLEDYVLPQTPDIVLAARRLAAY